MQMRFTEESRQPLPRPERPIGVAVLIIWNAFSAGLIPAIQAVLHINQAARSDGSEISLVTLCLSVGLPVTIVSASIGAFMGNDRARVALLILLTLFFGLDAFENIVQSTLATQPERILFGFARALWDGFWIAVNAWYFLRPSTIAFYRRPAGHTG